MTSDERNSYASILSNPMDLIAMIGDFAETIGSAKDLPQLGHCIVSRLSLLFAFPHAAIWVQDVAGEQYHLLAALQETVGLPLPPSVPSTHALFKRLAGNPSLPLYQQEESPSNGTSRPVEKTLYMPLRWQKGLVGLCALGPLDSTIPMGNADIAAVETMGRMAGTALGHHLAQDQLRHSSMLIRRTDRLRSLEIMAGGFAHEIRNPLTSIKTFIQLAPQRQQDTLFMSDFSRLAIEDVHRIEHLLHEILDYASYMTPQLSDVDLNELVTSCLCFISAAASQRGTCLRTALAPDLPVLSLDRQQIKQVILNLLLNALDAMPDGQGLICVNTRLLPPVTGIPRVQLQVEDDGCGIMPEHLDRIFDPFFTTKHSNSLGDGSGLGLTTAHQIVQDHGGTLMVKSQIGVGSTFSVDLPVPSARTTVSAARE